MTFLLNKLIDIFTNRTILNTPESNISLPSDFDINLFIRQLNKRILSLYGDYLSEDGEYVDYEGIRYSDEFVSIVQDTVLLNGIDLGLLAGEDRKAFYINLYNVAMIHSYAVNGDPVNWIDRSVLFSKTGYNIGPYFYSLDDIEHGLLRGNVRNPVSGYSQWEEGDPRLEYIVELDPRLHFALVCGAKSCPPIRIFTPGLLFSSPNFRKL
eukprot:TRINITY_DN4203_c0_g1_i1.p1 TRINITY_DN4203_c0_g1~~TRINITY_DN4203_c0_g1_i1.p1  ORF type:complete len:226 (-),score=31.06 TRINITY_DN4203_c0_g1_i1:233-862(-)